MKETYDFLTSHPTIGFALCIFSLIGLCVIVYLLAKKQIEILEISLPFLKLKPKTNINSNLTPISYREKKERKEIYEGNWVGKGIDIVVREEGLKSIFTYEADFRLITKEVTIYTEGFINVYKKNLLQFTLDFKANGTIYDGKCNLSYLLENKDISGFGVWNLHLNRDGTAFGYFISSRINNEGFGFGKMNFTKKGN